VPLPPPWSPASIPDQLLQLLAIAITANFFISIGLGQALRFHRVAAFFDSDSIGLSAVLGLDLLGRLNSS
jgi:hypothetical protein